MGTRQPYDHGSWGVDLTVGLSTVESGNFHEIGGALANHPKTLRPADLRPVLLRHLGSGQYLAISELDMEDKAIRYNKDTSALWVAVRCGI